MKNFDNVINNRLSEDWRSTAASLAAGATLAAAPLASANTNPSIDAHTGQPVSTNTQSVSNQTIGGVSMPALLSALEEVESNGDKNAIGDNGNAKGILQIWDSVVQDVNRIYKTKYTHDDAFDPQKARDIANKYLIYWGNQYIKREKKGPTYEILARIWNGGPRGYEKNSTIKYWEKVKRALQ